MEQATKERLIKSAEALLDSLRDDEHMEWSTAIAYGIFQELSDLAPDPTVNNK
jgi:hypothetical protein